MRSDITEHKGTSSALRDLLPGLAPLLLYILVDSFFGERAGIIAALVLGSLEFAYILIKEGRSDLFVLADTGLIVALGTASLCLDSPFAVKVKPALFEFIAAILFFILAALPKDKSASVIRRIVRLNIALSQVPRTVFFLLAALCAFHAAFVFIAAMYLSKGWWIFATTSFYFSPLLALPLPLYFRFIKPLYLRIRYKDDEWFNIVKPDGTIIGTMPRTLCHRGPGLLHPVVHLFLFDDSGNILLQKRSMSKSIQPGKWDTSVGGHVSAGESIEQALYRETEEELGLRSFAPRFLYRYIWEYEIESELVYTFAGKSDEKIQFSKDEIDAVSCFTVEQICSDSLELTPNLKHEMTLLKPYIESIVTGFK